MFPISDDNPQLGTPYATYLFIAFNIFAWFVLQGMGQEPVLQASVCKFGLIPADLLYPGEILTSGAFCPAVVSNSWANMMSSMFMHGSWMHLLGNMWFLWIFGDNVEDSMGTVRFAIFYILCGLLAAGAQVLSEPNSSIPMVGASGAIGGVMGAYIVLYPRVQVTMLLFLVVVIRTFKIPALMLLGYWIFIQFVGGLSAMGETGGGTAFWAHVGGFAAGTALIWLFKDEDLLRAHPHRGWKNQP